MRDNNSGQSMIENEWDSPASRPTASQAEREKEKLGCAGHRISILVRAFYSLVRAGNWPLHWRTSQSVRQLRATEGIGRQQM